MRVLNMAIAEVTSMPILMDLQSPAVSEGLLSYLSLVLGIVFFTGNNAGPFFLITASAAQCLRVLSPTHHRHSQPEPLSSRTYALLWHLSCLLSGMGDFTI